MLSISSVGKKCFIAVSLFLLAFPLFVHAEDDVEKMDVIGSHIKRTDVEGTSPILIIDREQIEMSGYRSLSDVLRDLPSSSLGGQRESSVSAFSVAYTSLRGLDVSNILILMNGRRSAFTDLQMIPFSAIERVEVLKDGASSIYGSDAVGGVINVVTKKGDVGGQINISGSLAQRKEGNGLTELASFVDFSNLDSEKNSWAGKGDDLSIDAAYGGTANYMNYLAGASLRFNAPLYLRDRLYVENENGQLQLGSLANQDLSKYGSPGSWKREPNVTDPNTAHHWQANPHCPAKNIKRNKKNVYCGFDYSPYMQLSPQNLQGNIFLQMDAELSEDSTFSGLALYSYRRTYSIIAPAPDTFAKKTNYKEGTELDYRISPTTAQTLGLDSSDPIVMYYRTVHEKGAGPRESIMNAHAYQVHGSLNHSITAAVESEVNLNLTGYHYKNTGISGYSNIDNLHKMLEAGVFKPTATADQKSRNDISSAYYEPVSTTSAFLTSIEPILTGELTDNLSFAVGGLGAWEMYLQDQDDITSSGKQWGGGVITRGEGDRWYGALYGELSALFAEMVELQLALRSDYYSDFGFPDQKIPFTNIGVPISPRAALSFQPIEQLKLRASWGKGFKAPALSVLHQAQTKTQPTVKDPRFCQADDCAQQETTIIIGNPELKSEYSENFNLGLVLDFNKVSFGFDVFQTYLRDVISKYTSGPELDASIQKLLNYEEREGPEALKAIGSEIKRDSSGAIDEIIAKPNNSENLKVQGFELGLKWQIPITGPWNLQAGLEHSHLLYVETDSKLDEHKNCPVPYYSWIAEYVVKDSCNDRRQGASLQTWYGYPRWKNKFSVNVINKDADYSILLEVHNIPGQLYLPEDPKPSEETEEKQELDYYWQVDITGSFSLTNKSSLILGVKNVLGSLRPRGPLFSNEGGYTNGNLYSVRGRSIDVRYTYNF